MPAPFLSLGRYQPGRSLVHNLDARAKLLAVLFLTTAAVWSTHVLGQVALLLLLAAAFSLARLPLSLLSRALRAALWLLLFVAAINLAWGLIVRHAEWAGGQASINNLTELAVLLSRLLNLILVGVLFTATTIPVDAAEGFQRLLRPLRRLKLPVDELGMLLVLSLSFIPIFLQEARHLTAAHRMKMGAVRWGWRHRLGAVVPLLVPLFMSVLRRGDELAVALDARCYLPGGKRTSLVRGRLGFAELGIVATSALPLAACVWL